MKYTLSTAGFHRCLFEGLKMVWKWFVKKYNMLFIAVCYYGVLVGEQMQCVFVIFLMEYSIGYFFVICLGR